MRNLSFILLLLISFKLTAQKKYLVYFTDKIDSPYSIDNPLDYLSQKSIDRRTKQNISITDLDLPVNPYYLDSIQTFGAEVVYTSKWLNAAFIVADSSEMDSINLLSFVSNSTILERTNSNGNYSDKCDIITKPISNSQNSKSGENYGVSFDQIQMLGVNTMHRLGYLGEGMTIAVIDNGFTGVDAVSAFQTLNDESRILSTYDFVNNEIDVYNDGSHGTMVLSTMAAELDGEMYGTAYKADYHLFVSENINAEMLDEEVYWVIAAEKADSLGADLINTSLGYSKFDSSYLNHTYADLDGETTIISKASKIAANTGILLVTSAGNSGTDSWHYITAPGDAKKIITAGAVDINYVKTDFSSVGPTADGRIKPDLSALGLSVAVVKPNGAVELGNGTSFSSPLLCGLAAGFWQAHQNLTSQEVISYLKQSATQSDNPDTLQGWGVPNFESAHVLAGGTIGINQISNEQVLIYPSPVTKGAQLSISSPVQVNDVVVLSLLGEQLKSYEINSNNYKLDLKYLPSGTYFIFIRLNNDITEIRKIQLVY